MVARVVGMERAIEPGATITLAVGDVLELAPATGARGYLAVPGGIDVPVVLGSRSTVLGAGFGGLDGRALRPGDRLAAGDPDRLLPPAQWPGTAAPEPVDAGHPLRVVPCPHADELGHATLEGLRTTPWTVSPTSDRVGIRLDGPALDPGTATELASHGVTEGAVQLPPDGRPIVLLVDHQPTGGYPVVAVVISADRARLGQLAPGAAAHFEVATAGQARALLAADREAMDEALDHLHDTARGDGSRRGAGA
jgi:biotin-dependent carboxylase-like uncharacterized protein